MAAATDSGRRAQTGGSSAQRSQDEKQRPSNTSQDGSHAIVRYMYFNRPCICSTGRRERDMESKRAPASRTTKTEPTLKQEAENSATTAIIKNDAIIGGLALQRLCDEKPDIDNLTNSLMQLYYNIQFKGGEGDGHKDILNRIVLSALRVKSKMELHINRVPRIERNFINMCRNHQKNKSFNELYDRVNKVLGKIPGLAQLEVRAQQLRAKQMGIVDNIESLKRQIQTQKSQLENLCKIMSDGIVK
ncbi:hypothetical protein X943_001828 [Babesia divergens]|uniref:Uncharacterized protein n=1 Tax=Babesia divergens TaxID=32595 RepID=A0AAD9G725_BABDI|nr:hypothetical protein X943_001828 [Babesia divergens]